MTKDLAAQTLEEYGYDLSYPVDPNYDQDGNPHCRVHRSYEGKREPRVACGACREIFLGKPQRDRSFQAVDD